jgi:photosystem II stability/assembly factor-like uncharacterized protein
VIHRGRDAAGSTASLVAVTHTTLVAVRSGGGLAASFDAGRHWRRTIRATGTGPTWVSFGDPRHGLAAVGSGDLWRTTDGGRRWTPVAVAVP